MNLIAEDSAIIAKTKDLCASIVDQPDFKALQESVVSFLNNDEARLQYQSVHERGEELNYKQRSGVELSDKEIDDFESAREALLENTIVTDFMQAQRDLQGIQKQIGQYVSLTLELGRVPSEEDLMASSGGGCCGGGGGGGCGC